MQFFEHQEEARGRTTLLVVMFVFAVLALTGTMCVVTHFALAAGADPNKPLPETHWSLVITAGVATLSVIVLGAAFRSTQLLGGGKKVAESLGGTLISPETRDPLERRAINLVEEMAIASGMPVPPVYLMRREQNINAFAAGWSQDDAVIGLTRGALEGLTRDQLQGVIAHEFSHIINRDSALNMRLLGILHGIVLISLIGRLLIEFGSTSSRSDSKNNPGPALALAGVAVWLLGSLGVLAARCIQSAVSRQREYLADASAVQFTRNPSGIAGALATIGVRGSGLRTANGGEVGHMLIGNAGQSSFTELLSSHPPLQQRIGRILPQWDGNLLALATPEGGVERQLQAEMAATRGESSPGVRGHMAPAAVAASAGLVSQLQDVSPASSAPAAAAVSSAAWLLNRISPALREAAANPFSARALILAWVMDEDHEQRLTQLALLGGDPGLAAETERLLRALPALDPVALLPLFDIAVGALAGLSDRQRKDFYETLRTVQAQLSHNAYRGYCLSAVTLRRLDPLWHASHARPMLAKTAVETMLGVLAMRGHDDARTAARAFEAGVQLLGKRGGVLHLPRPAELTVQHLNDAFSVLISLDNQTRINLLQVAEVIAGHDGVVRPREAELLRAMATCLNVATRPAFASA